MTSLTFGIIFLAVFVALVLGQLGRSLTLRWGLVDHPNSKPHKVHLAPVPLAGGIVVFFTMILAGVGANLLAMPAVWPILVASSVVFVFGLFDDARSLTPLVKLGGQFIASVLLIYLGVQVRLLPQEWLNWAITIFWMVGITNAFNFVDSMDGLATGLGGLAAAFFMLVTFDAGQIELSLFSALILGACLGSYYYNSQPARYFLGDSGAQLLGFALAAVAIEFTPVGFIRLQSWYVPILLLAVPIFDASLVVYSRLRRGKPAYLANLDHTYHRLVRMGVNSNRAVLSMHLAALLIGCLAFIMLPLPPLLGNLVFTACVVTGAVLIVYLDRKSWWK